MLKILKYLRRYTLLCVVHTVCSVSQDLSLSHTHAHARARSHTHKYVIFIGCPQQMLLRERASLLRFTFTVFSSITKFFVLSQASVLKAVEDDKVYTGVFPLSVLSETAIILQHC